MIQPQELRIGNYYQSASRGNIKIVTWQTLRDLSEGKLNLMSIPLSEEILLKFGFEIKYLTIEKKINSSFAITLIPPYEGHKYYHFMPSVTLQWGVDLEFVHQLQNLYFALTGEELKFEDIS